MVDRADAASGHGDCKLDMKAVSAGRAVVEDPEAAILEDVEVAKVEAVYRYVIKDSLTFLARTTNHLLEKSIAGSFLVRLTLPINPSITTLTNPPQPSGSSTSSAPPSAPTSASPKP